MDSECARRGLLEKPCAVAAAPGRAGHRSANRPSTSNATICRALASVRCAIVRALRFALARRADRASTSIRAIRGSRSCICWCRSTHRLRLRLKVPLFDADAHGSPRVNEVWPAANWLEREVWDLFGIVFDGHPDPDGC